MSTPDAPPVKDDLVVHFDGLCQPVNPGGIACWGFVARRGGSVLHAARGLAAEPFDADASSNVAEYTGLVRALEWIAEQGLAEAPVRIYGDSMLVVKQVEGAYRVRSERLLPLHARVRELLAGCTAARLAWVPRAENAEADEQTELAYEELLDADADLRARATPYLASPGQRAHLESRGVTVGRYLSRLDFLRWLSVFERREAQAAAAAAAPKPDAGGTAEWAGGEPAPR